MTEKQAPQERGERDRTVAAKSRAADDSTRLERATPMTWKPTELIDVPRDPRYEYRWVAEYVYGTPLASSVHRRMGEGFVRVRIEELPEDFLLYEERHEDSFVRHGGLILMRMPIELYRQRQAYYERRRTERVESANELQGVAGRDAVKEDRGSRTLMGEDAGRALMEMNRA